MTDPRLARPLWRGRTNVDALTIACIEKAEKIGGHEFIITQGSYQSSVAASAGTHDRGGAVDLGWCGHGSCVRALREAGMAATWHRTPAQGPWNDHVHAVVYGHPDLAPSAARQIDSVIAGRNGLANNGPDDGPRLNPFPKAVWPPQEDDMTPEQNDRLVAVEHAVDRIEESQATILAALRKKGENSWNRDVDIKTLVREVLAEVRDEGDKPKP